jgi:hypothetical protein
MVLWLERRQNESAVEWWAERVVMIEMIFYSSGGCELDDLRRMTVMV